MILSSVPNELKNLSEIQKEIESVDQHLEMKCNHNIEYATPIKKSK